MEGDRRRFANRLGAQLQRIEPALWALCPGADEPWLWALLDRAPKPAHILVVEDERQIARFIELELIHEGYQVTLATDGIEALIQVRQNRLLSMGADSGNDDYIDRQAVADEVAHARRLSAKFSWAQLDVTRRSIEETAAAVLKLFTDRQRQRLPE